MELKKCFLAAVKEELDGQTIIDGIPVIYTGVGKVNAAIAATDAIHQGFNAIINIGSCGSKKHAVGEILKIGKVYQDIDGTPICDYGLTPFEPPASFLSLDRESTFTCFTTDYFYDEKQRSKYSAPYLHMIQHASVFDMELYAIAKACAQHGISCSAYKWVADDGDFDHWSAHCKASLDLLRHTVQL